MTGRDRRRLARYYLDGRLYRGLPNTILFSPTLRCNLACIHCGIWKERAQSQVHLDPAGLSKFLESPLFRRVEQFWLSGGEPTLLPNLAQYVAAAWQRLPALHSVGLITNGFLPGRLLERIQELLSGIPPSGQRLYVHLSVDGEPEVHDRIRGVAGAFKSLDRSLEAVLALRKTQPRIEPLLNCVIQPDNAATLGAVQRWASDREVPITFNLLSITGGFYCNQEGKERLGWTPEAREAALGFIRELASSTRYPLKGHYENVANLLSGGRRHYRCVTMESTFYLDGDGRSWACPVGEEHTLGRAPEQSPEAIWNGPASSAARRKIKRELCDGCGLSCSIGDGMNFSEYLHQAESVIPRS